MFIFSSATLEWGHFALDFKTKEADRDSFFHILVDLQGFYTGAPIKGDVHERSWGHGAYAQRRFRAARKLTLTATLLYKTDLERHMASNEIAAVMGSGLPGKLTVNVDGVGPLSMEVFIDGEIEHKFNYQYQGVDIQIPLIAPDPYRYGPTQNATMVMKGFGEGLVFPLMAPSGTNLHFGDSAPASHTVLHNQGTAPCAPVYTVQGDWPSGFTIVADGKAVEYDGPVFRESPVTVDMRGHVTQGGQDRTYLLTRRQWHTVPPGGAIYPRITSRQRGTGWCDIMWRDTHY